MYNVTAVGLAPMRVLLHFDLSSIHAYIHTCVYMCVFMFMYRYIYMCVCMYKLYTFLVEIYRWEYTRRETEIQSYQIKERKGLTWKREIWETTYDITILLFALSIRRLNLLLLRFEYYLEESYLEKYSIIDYYVCCLLQLRFRIKIRYIRKMEEVDSWHIQFFFFFFCSSFSLLSFFTFDLPIRKYVFSACRIYFLNVVNKLDENWAWFRKKKKRKIKNFVTLELEIFIINRCIKDIEKFVCCNIHILLLWLKFCETNYENFVCTNSRKNNWKNDITFIKIFLLFVRSSSIC